MKKIALFLSAAALSLAAATAEAQVYISPPVVQVGTPVVVGAPRPVVVARRYHRHRRYVPRYVPRYRAYRMHRHHPRYYRHDRGLHRGWYKHHGHRHGHW